MKLNLDQIRALIELLEASDLTEIEVAHDDDRIRLRREPAPVVAAPHAQAAAPPPPAPHDTEPTAPSNEGTFVTSPFVGTFYRAPSPDKDPFVELGQEISPGQVLCIVEAMKLMNEIEAEVEGKVIEILIEDGKPVEYGDRLFRIEPL